MKRKKERGWRKMNPNKTSEQKKAQKVLNGKL